jgi:hypothetical protein
LSLLAAAVVARTQVMVVVALVIETTLQLSPATRTPLWLVVKVAPVALLTPVKIAILLMLPL